MLRRYLMHLGYRVTYVQNVTDIDDRSIAAAWRPDEDWHAIVAGYYAEFKASMRKLDVLDSTTNRTRRSTSSRFKR